MMSNKISIKKHSGMVCATKIKHIFLVFGKMTPYQEVAANPTFHSL